MLRALATRNNHEVKNIRQPVHMNIFIFKGRRYCIQTKNTHERYTKLPDEYDNIIVYIRNKWTYNHINNINERMY